jgi:hypothetical protein
MALATSLAMMWDDGGIPRYIKLGIPLVRMGIPTSLLLIMINEYSGWAVEINAIHMV